MSTRIGAYQRISDDAEGLALGVERQRVDTHALARARGWVVAGDYTDNNVSAYRKNVVRPEFERLIKDLESGAVDGIVAYDIDRTMRQPRDLERLIDIYESRPGLVFATVQGDINLASSDGRFIARMLVNVANKSSADTSRRIKRKLLENAVDGKPHGARYRPFGYQEDWRHLDSAESAILREMGHLFLKGYSYNEVAWRINDQGSRMQNGREWYAGAVRDMLIRPRNGGFRIVDGVRYEGKWEAVYSEDEWDAIQRMVAKRSLVSKERPTNRSYPLTGLLTCGKCGHHLCGMGKAYRKDEPPTRTYQCRSYDRTVRSGGGCHASVIQADPLEHFLREVICARLDTPQLASAMTEPSDDQSAVRDLLARQRALTQARDRIITDYAADPFDYAAYKSALTQVNAQIEAIDQEIVRTRPPQIALDITPGDSVREAWDRNPAGWRRELIGILIESITIEKGRKLPAYWIDGKRHVLDPERVSVAWKV